MLALINYLVSTFGIAEVKKPSKEGSLGFMIWEPQPFQADVLKSLAQAVDWNVIHNKATSKHPKTGEDVAPHLYIGPASGGFDNSDDVLEYAMSCVQE